MATLNDVRDYFINERQTPIDRLDAAIAQLNWNVPPLKGLDPNNLDDNGVFAVQIEIGSQRVK